MEPEHQSGLLLSREVRGESTLMLCLLLEVSGYTVAFQRIPSSTRSRAGGRTQETPDLFDTAEIQMASKSRFIAEYRLVRRRSRIGSSLSALEAASRFARILMTNLPQMPHEEGLYDECTRVFDAFDEGLNPDLVLLKALYRLTRQQGYGPSEWLKHLPAAEAALATHWLHTPVSSNAVTNASLAPAELVLRFMRWMAEFTDFSLPEAWIRDKP